MIPVVGWIIRETERAVLFMPKSDMDKVVWLPKSQIAVTPREFDDLLKIPGWLMESSGLWKPWQPPMAAGQGG